MKKLTFATFFGVFFFFFFFPFFFFSPPPPPLCFHEVSRDVAFSYRVGERGTFCKPREVPF